MSFRKQHNLGAPPTGGPDETQGRKKNPTKKVVDRHARFAILFAVLAALLVGAFMMSKQAPSQYVVVTNAPVNALTPLAASMLTAVPADSAKLVQTDAITGKTEKDALAAAKAIEGLRTRYPLAKGAQISKDLFGPGLALPTPLGADERLISVNVNVAAAVAGQIQAGDSVDVFGDANNVSGLIASDVNVVSVTVSEDQYNAVAEQQTGAEKNSSPSSLLPGDPVPGIYVLRVKADDAMRIEAVAAEGNLALIYRGANSTDTASTPMSATDAICGGQTTTQACANAGAITHQ